MTDAYGSLHFSAISQSSVDLGLSAFRCHPL